MELLKIVGIVFCVLFVGYIAVRLWSSAYFRSKFEASKLKDKKEE